MKSLFAISMCFAAWNCNCQSINELLTIIDTISYEQVELRDSLYNEARLINPNHREVIHWESRKYYNSDFGEFMDYFNTTMNDPTACGYRIYLLATLSQSRLNWRVEADSLHALKNLILRKAQKDSLGTFYGALNLFSNYYNDWIPYTLDSPTYRELFRLRVSNRDSSADSSDEIAMEDIIKESRRPFAADSAFKYLEVLKSVSPESHDWNLPYQQLKCYLGQEYSQNLDTALSKGEYIPYWYLEYLDKWPCDTNHKYLSGTEANVSRILSLMNTKRLFPRTSITTYRLTIMPTFSAPLTIEIRIQGSDTLVTTTTANILSGYSYDIPTKVTSTSWPLDTTSLAAMALIENYINRPYRKMEYGGILDGTTYFFEFSSPDGYDCFWTGNWSFDHIDRFYKYYIEEEE
ncbi:hypothetical protein [Phaeocystidibacter luteus]|uniref:Uncharacterized protein n=1 Tax=Phaeocystidibacter luteus TaxID=911197 RepID=A0A6N6RH14_9FLAO|nr:hypothetical protein [Phaeocystidibacter luteus]KAB2810403.1 hypothetical protein F8C67_07385 [Phaeocystidibacter luteus]